MKDKCDCKLAGFEERYKIARNQIQNEAELINNRITWMLTIHGFLYATYGITVQKILDINERLTSRKIGSPLEFCNGVTSNDLRISIFQILVFLGCICLIGSAISLLAYRSLLAAHQAMTSIKFVFQAQYKPIDLNEAMDPLTSKVEKIKHKIQIYMIAHENGSSSFFPSLTGDGQSINHARGFFAAKYIPWALIAGWVISFVFLLILLVIEIRLLYFTDCEWFIKLHRIIFYIELLLHK